MKTSVLLSTTLLSALTCMARPADACSPILPYVESVAPADGASAVPSNPALFVLYSGGQSRYQVSYQVAGATTSIDLGEVPDVLSSDPVGTLAFPGAAPGTQATVTLTPLDGGQQSPTTTTFSYGSTEDRTAPSAPPAPVLDIERVKADGNTCGPVNDGDAIKVGVPSGLDADAVAYAVFATSKDSSGTLIGDGSPRTRWALLADGTPTLNLGYYGDPEDVCVQARTADLAGNWSAPSAETCVTVNSGCTSVQGSLPMLGALALWLGLGGLFRRRRA